MRKNKDLFSIFPADAGVNLFYLRLLVFGYHIPRGCGGEPRRFYDIFPADAGVNPIRRPYRPNNRNIPRGCGGEPLEIDRKLKEMAYSPRMRG